MRHQWKVFAQWAAACTGFAATVLLAKGSLASSAGSVARQSGSYFDYNPEALRSIAAQTADGKVGFVILVLAFALGIWALAMEIGAPIENRTKGVRLAQVSGIACGLLCLALGFFASAIIADRLAFAAKKIVDPVRISAPAKRIE